MTVNPKVSDYVVHLSREKIAYEAECFVNEFRFEFVSIMLNHQCC